MNHDDLVAHEEIRQQLYRYCRAVDRCDEAMGHSVWHADGTADYGETYYVGGGQGVIDLICRHHRATQMHSHQLTNVLIEVAGDKGASESTCFATLRIERERQTMQMQVWTRYVDRWSRRDGRWAIDHRIALRDFDEVRAITPMSDQRQGSRDRNDPSYQAFAELR